VQLVAINGQFAAILIGGSTKRLSSLSLSLRFYQILSDSLGFSWILGDSGGFWGILGDSGRFWEILGDSGRFWKILCEIPVEILTYPSVNSSRFFGYLLRKRR